MNASNDNSAGDDLNILMQKEARETRSPLIADSPRQYENCLLAKIDSKQRIKVLCAEREKERMVWGIVKHLISKCSKLAQKF